MVNDNAKALRLIFELIMIIEQRLIKNPLHNSKNLELISDSINFRMGVIGEGLLKIKNGSKAFFSESSDSIQSILFQTTIIKKNYEAVNFEVSKKICFDDLPILKQKIQTFLSDNNETV